MKFNVEFIPSDEIGLRFYFSHYKPFRLLSLQSNPSSFGSTFALEQAFDDERWSSRLLNPQARTFVALEDETRQILSSVTLFVSHDVPNELKSTLRGPVSRWDLNGVFTLPEARRQGIAAATMAAAKQYAEREASFQGKDCLLTAVVYAANLTAKSYYENEGFAEYKRSQDQGRATCELALVSMSGDAAS